MSKVSSLLAELGYPADSASATGSANAKLTLLLARLTSASLFEGTQVLPVIYPTLAMPLSMTSAARN